ARELLPLLAVLPLREGLRHAEGRDEEGSQDGGSRRMRLHASPPCSKPVVLQAPCLEPCSFTAVSRRGAVVAETRRPRSGFRAAPPRCRRKAAPSTSSTIASSGLACRLPTRPAGPRPAVPHLRPRSRGFRARRASAR